MSSANRPGELKDQLTIPYLESTYMDHHPIVEKLALSEIQSLNLAMPKFNTLAALSRTEFNELLSHLRGKWKDTKTFPIIVAATIDTYTCMIQSRQFYEGYAGDNKLGLKRVLELLNDMNGLIAHCEEAVDSKQLPILIGMLEKSASRIQNNAACYGNMLEIIHAIKIQMQSRLEVEKNAAAQMENVHIPPELQHDKNLVGKIRVRAFETIKENSKPLPASNNKQKVSYPVKPKNKRATEKNNQKVSHGVKPKNKKSRGKDKTPFVKPLRNGVTVSNNLNMNDGRCIANDNKSRKVKPLQNQVTTGTSTSNTLSINDDCCTVNNNRSRTVKQLKKRIVNEPVQKTPLKPKINNKPANAFELMMKSSKLKVKKKPGKA